MTKGTVRYAFLCCNSAAARSRFYSSTTACCLVSIAKCFNLMLKILKSALNPIQEFHSFTSQKLLPLSASLPPWTLRPSSLFLLHSFGFGFCISHCLWDFCRRGYVCDVNVSEHCISVKFQSIFEPKMSNHTELTGWWW